MSTSSPALLLSLIAVGGLALSGLPGLFLPWRSAWGPRLGTALVTLFSAVGASAAGWSLAAGETSGLALASPLAGRWGALGIDPLSAFFALPVYLLGALGALYGVRYWPVAEHPRHGRRLRLFYGVMLGAMAAVTLARDGISLLVAWEAMALATFFALTTEEGRPPTRRAGWVYLLYAHLSLLCLVAAVLLLAGARGDLALAPVAAGALAPGRATAIFTLALAGFGTKAGLVPLHSWLPGAHAAAPTHVSALMSGVALKIGLYGIVRMSGLLPALPLPWGGVVLALGAASAFCGVVYALGQHDLKRLLAYHSIENVGIMAIGLGLAMMGRAAGRVDWVLLGLGGCLLHVWNHALFKPLLFFGAGAVAKTTGSRDLERAGGLARRMPVTAAGFLVGAIAISGLPPLNGFVSELLVYLGLVRAVVGGGAAGLAAALAAPVLAAVGALAVACFVKVYGVVFLGTARTAAAAQAREAPATMRLPMVLLAAACAAIGLLPAAVAPALERAMLAWAPGAVAGGARLAGLAPWWELSGIALMLVLAAAALATRVAPAVRRARERAPELPTWDCGYAIASPRLQYTGSSFAQPVTSRFAWLLRARGPRPRVEGLFPAPARFESRVADALLDDLLEPLARWAMRLSGGLRAHPRGQLQRYLLWVVAAVAVLLVWSLV